MNNWSKLPIEILLNIFQWNDYSTNTQCSLTCRNWKYTAQLILFETMPAINEEKLDLMSKALSIYQNNCSDFGLSPGNYVRTVDCLVLSDAYDWKLLDRLFPFLEVIAINDYSKPPHKKIYSLLQEGKFPNLKQLPMDGFTRPPPELLLARRERIKNIWLYSISLKDKILQNLHLFTSLKRLDLHYREVEHLENLFPKEIINLKSLSIEFTEHSENLDATLINIDDIQPFRNTRKLVITNNGFLYDDNYILYIMKKFPNLEAFQLSKNLQYGNEYDVFPTIDCLFQFFVYLSKMKKCAFAGATTNKSAAPVLKKYLDYVIDQRPVYYKNTLISLHIHFNFMEPGQEDNHPPDYIEFIGFESRKKGFDAYKVDRCNLSVMYNVLQETTFQSHLQLFREIGNTDINFLTIDNKNLYQSSVPLPFDKIFSHFSKLVFLHVSKIVINKEYFLEETLNPNIKRMKYTKCAISKDVFPIISKRCQNLTFLHLENCYYNYNENPFTNRYYPVSMPSTCLQELKISLNNNKEFPFENAFIRLVTKNKKTRYCKITTELGSPTVNFSEQDRTEDHYNMCLDEDFDCGIFDIHCESVVKLTVEFETDDCGIMDDIDSSDEEDEEEKEKEECAFKKIREYLEEDL